MIPLSDKFAQSNPELGLKTYLVHVFGQIFEENTTGNSTNLQTNLTENGSIEEFNHGTREAKFVPLQYPGTLL